MNAWTSVLVAFMDSERTTGLSCGCVQASWGSQPTGCLFSLLGEYDWHYDSSQLLCHAMPGWVVHNLLAKCCMFIAEISACNIEPWSGSYRAGNCKQRPASRAEQSDECTEPTEAGIFIFYSAYRGNWVTAAGNLWDSSGNFAVFPEVECTDAFSVENCDIFISIKCFSNTWRMRETTM